MRNRDDLTGDEAVLGDAGVARDQIKHERILSLSVCNSSDEQSQLTPLLFGMPYHKEQAGDVNPLDKVRREFTRLQKRNEQTRIRN